ncbi:MAG: hypothetical protein Tsb0021_08890 [Chlamydiales bacterium]
MENVNHTLDQAQFFAKYLCFRSYFVYTMLKPEDQLLVALKVGSVYAATTLGCLAIGTSSPIIPVSSAAILFTHETYKRDTLELHVDFALRTVNLAGLVLKGLFIDPLVHSVQSVTMKK